MIDILWNDANLIPRDLYFMDHKGEGKTKYMHDGKILSWKTVISFLLKIVVYGF